MSLSPLLGAVLLFLHVFLYPYAASAGEEELASLLKRAETLLTQESYPAAIAILETMLSQDPKNAEALDRLVRACDLYIQKLIAEDRVGQVQTYLQKMEDAVQNMEAVPETKSPGTSSVTQSRIKRELANAKAFLQDGGEGKGANVISLAASREQYNEAVDHFMKHEYEMAERMLTKSVELDSSNPYAFQLLAEIANLNHELAEAEEYYRKAFSLNPDPLLREKYEKVILERKIDKTKQQYTDEHFIIRYRRDENLEGSRLREYLREAYQDVSEEFGYYPKYKIPVVLYDRTEYLSLMSSVPHWSAAFFDGKIRLPVYAGPSSGVKNEHEIKKLIYHELTHAFILDLSRVKCPLWLNEGLAQYEENKVQPVNLKPLSDAVQAKTLIGLDEIVSYEAPASLILSKAQLFYVESFSLVSYLIEKSRFYHLKKLLIALGEGQSFYEAFEKIFGRTFQDVASDWQHDLERRYGGL